MPDDTERLVVALEARIRDFERGMQRAEQRGTRTYGQLAAGSTRATRQMETDMVRSTQRMNQALAQTSTRIGSFGKAFAGGLVVGATVGVLEGIRQAAIDSTKSVLEMADAAKRAGVSFKAFQELKFVAEQNRIDIDSLTDGLKELSLRADEFIKTGQGSAAEAFQRLGYDAATLAEKLKQPDQLFLEIIGKLQRLDKAAQIRIADEVFGGTGGEKFVQLIEQGEAGIRAQIQAANDLGVVMDDQMIATAEKVNQAFNVIATTIGTHIKSAIVNAVAAWTEFLDSYNEFKDQQAGTLRNRQAELGSKRLDLETEKMQIQAGDGGFPYWNKDGPLAKGRIHEIEMELAKIAEEERKIVEEQNKRLKALPPAGSTAPAPIVAPPASPSTKSGSSQNVDLLRFLAAGKDASHIRGMSSGFESKLEKMLAALPKELAGQITINSGFRSVERQQQLWQQALAKYGSVAEARKWVAPPGNSQHNKGNAADLGYGSDAARQWAHDNASKFGLSFPLGNENWHIEDSEARAGAMADRTAELESRGQAYDDLLAKGREFIASQDMETQALGLTEEAAARLRYEQQLLNEAQQAGLDLSLAQISSIKTLAGEMAAAEERARQFTESQERMREAAAQFAAVGKDVTKGFISDLMNGKSAAEALQGALSKIADVLLDQVLDAVFQVNGAGGTGGGGGGFLNLFGSLFGGAFPAAPKVGLFAKGGISDRPAIFAEAGPEAAVPLPDGRRIPVDLGKSAGGGKTKVDVSVGVRIDQDGNLQAFVERVSYGQGQRAAGEAVDGYDRVLPDRIQKFNRDPRKRAAR